MGDAAELEKKWKTARLLGDRVMVIDEPVEEKTPGGLFVLSHRADAIHMGGGRIGRVLAVGNGRRNKRGERMPIEEIEVGTMLMYPRTMGSLMEKIDKEERWIRLLSVDQVSGVVE